MITAYAQNGHSRQGLGLFRKLLLLDSKVANIVSFISVIKSCCNERLEECRWIHGLVDEAGLSTSNIVVGTALINMYAVCGSVADAEAVFGSMESRNEITWSALIAAHAAVPGHACQIWDIFRAMENSGVVPNEVTFISMLSSCTVAEDLSVGRLIHEAADKYGYGSDVVVGNSVLNMYGKCGDVDRARQLFDEMGDKHAAPVAWNSLMGAYTQTRNFVLAVELFSLMQLEGVIANKVTFLAALNACAGLAEMTAAYASQQGHDQDVLRGFHLMHSHGLIPEDGVFVAALNACSNLGALKQGKLVHYLVRETGVESTDVFTALVNMYGKCGELLTAREIFSSMPDEFRDALTWNGLINAHTQHGKPEEALSFYRRMQQEGTRPRKSVFVSVLNAVAALGSSVEGRRIHEQVAECSLDLDSTVGTLLVNMYAKSGDVDTAWEIFERMQHSDTVTWNSMLGACIQQRPRSSEAPHEQQENEAVVVRLFARMLLEGIRVDRVTLLTMLSACASHASLSHGKKLHGLVSELNLSLESDTGLFNALVTMYSRCGSWEVSQAMFHAMGSCHGDLITWNSMITACARHGQALQAVELVRGMEQAGWSPDKVTLTVILSACSHAGLLDKAYECFQLMRGEYEIDPGPDHYGSIVDLLCRAGKLGEAEALIEKLPDPASAVTWRSLLGGCSNHGDLVLGRRAADELFGMDPRHHTTYVMLSNTYCG
ncbi:pentatricopeptide repeat-containing protein At1g05750, chloroplastic isoform X2 [Selaginella moellendorffii]|nr:pentatricopeptide repeat-containing protein At1g05750, chloroplastic isoform X2 [Selaginella moellendorffii]|eukprot:XP_024528316.1 pentatricopeptide repeat-containing protein At1g05750, chloroplastic isoform X2 [Selaginella moellendorffii]